MAEILATHKIYYEPETCIELGPQIFPHLICPVTPVVFEIPIIIIQKAPCVLC